MFLLDRVGNEEQIQFSYDMVAGYHIANQYWINTMMQRTFVTL